MMGDAAPVNQGAELALKLCVADAGGVSSGTAEARELGAKELQALRSAESRFSNAVNKNSGRQRASLFYLACVYKNSSLYKAWRMNGVGSVKFSASAFEGDYFRAELFGLPRMPLPLRLLYGYMIAVTNPVDVGAVLQGEP